MPPETFESQTPAATPASATTTSEALSPADESRLVRWREHLRQHGVTVPDEAEFRAFGGLSTLERLHRVLRRTTPEHCGPLGLVISDLKAQKNARAGSKATGGQRGPARTRSIAKEDLRADWRETLDGMAIRRARLDKGRIDFEDRLPPALSQQRNIEYVLRSVSQVCLDHGFEIELSKETVKLWLEREESSGRRPSGLSQQLRKIAEFLAYRGEKPKLRRRIKDLARDMSRRARLQRKKKFQFLAEHPLDIGKVWLKAEDLLAKGRMMPAGSKRRQLVVLHAACLALSIAMPLRISDLHRLRVGIEIRRDALGWHSDTDTRKTSDLYDQPQMWDELSAFLDEVVAFEAPGNDLWTGYDRRQGTFLFSRDGGRSGMTADWMSDVFHEHVGIGQHIVRTLWHQIAEDSDVDLIWMSLALCGQRGPRTHTEYRERGARVRAVRVGRRALAALRQAERVASTR